MPVAFDLARNEKGLVVVGKETEIACNEALKIYEETRRKDWIVVTAGSAGPKWNNAWMAKLMEQYMLSIDESVTIFKRKAKTFNTYGEMEALAELCQELPIITDVVLAVKWWHAKRCNLLCQYHLEKRGVKGRFVFIRRCSSEARVEWRTREYLAYFKDWLKVKLRR